jgi:hypothetical protein
MQYNLDLKDLNTHLKLVQIYIIFQLYTYMYIYIFILIHDNWIRRMKGIEFQVVYEKLPVLWVIRKQNRFTEWTGVV